MYPVGQKVCSGFSIRCYGKTQMNCLANPILLEPAMQRWSLLSSIRTWAGFYDFFMEHGGNDAM